MEVETLYQIKSLQIQLDELDNISRKAKKIEIAEDNVRYKKFNVFVEKEIHTNFNL